MPPDTESYKPDMIVITIKSAIQLFEESPRGVLLVL
jgi:hypothetical protein